MALRVGRNAGVVAGILLTTFLYRYAESGWRSYWYDELLSVYTYGIAQPSFSEMLTNLISYSVHPPLYQSILWFWMQIFGSNENQTRLLSNLYVLGASIAGYFLFLRLGKRQALTWLIFFSLSFTAIRFSLEARSYAQTLFLRVRLRMLKDGRPAGA